MDKLSAIKIFCVVAETLHFREASQRLAVSPQVITRTINELEQELGEVLFKRSTRQVRLSDFGQQFLPQAQRLLNETEQLFQLAKQPKQSTMAGVVRVAVPDIPMMTDVLQELWQRLAPYPELKLDWRSDLHLIDVIEQQIDVGLRFGTPKESNLIVRKVGIEQDCIVASPQLITRLGVPKDWQDLQNYPLSSLINHNTGRAWAWYLSDEMQLHPTSPKLFTNHMHNELATVLAGQTVACLPCLLCKPYIERGEMVELFAEQPRKSWDAYLYRPQTKVTPARVKWVFDELADILAKKLL